MYLHFYLMNFVVLLLFKKKSFWKTNVYLMPHFQIKALDFILYILVWTGEEKCKDKSSCNKYDYGTGKNMLY